MQVLVLIFLVVFLVCACAAARALARMGRQLDRADAEFERLAGRLEDRLLPRAEVVFAEIKTHVRELKATAEHARSARFHFEATVASLGDIAVAAGDAVQPIVATAASVGVDRRRVRAIRAGVGVMFGRLFGRRA